MTGVKEARMALAELGLIDPTDEHNAQKRAAKRLDTVASKRAALLDNRKGNADLLLERVGEILTEKYGVAEAVPVQKFIYSRRAEPELLDQIAGEYDFVVAAIGD
jgi:hypothetical protein